MNKNLGINRDNRDLSEMYNVVSLFTGASGLDIGFEEYTRLIKDLEAKSFVFENVKDIKSMFNCKYLVEICNQIGNNQ